MKEINVDCAAQVENRTASGALKSRKC